MSNLELALVAIRDHELMQLPAESELQEVLSLSQAFERRMEKLWRSTGSKTTRRKTKQILLIAILAAMMASIMSVQAIREPVVNFLMDIYDRCTDIIFQISANEAVEEIDFYVPAPPAGYVETGREELQTQVKVEYANRSGGYMRYTQYDLEGLSLSVDTENADVRVEEIRGISVFTYSKNGLNSIVWSDGNFGYKVNATCSFPELMEIVEDVISVVKIGDKETDFAVIGVLIP